MNATVEQLVRGAVAGLGATVPMTAAMAWLHSRLPRPERYPLPPREITMNAAAEAGLEPQHLPEAARTGMTLAAHFGYGAFAGALYALLSEKAPLPAPVKGVGHALAVWAGSYLGLMPALGLLAPATRHPPRRNAVMLAAHVVWGAAVGALAEALRGDPR